MHAVVAAVLFRWLRSMGVARSLQRGRGVASGFTQAGASMVDLVSNGRRAVASYNWETALESFLAADRDSQLSPSDLSLLAEAQWWQGDPDGAERTMERAFTAFRDEGANSDAAIMATRLAGLAFSRLAVSVGSAWLSRAERLVESEPDSPAQAWIGLERLFVTVMIEGDMARGLPLTDEVLEIAHRTGAKEAVPLAMGVKGMIMVMQGEWREGMALIDEAAVLSISEQGDLRSTSGVYCITISACSTLADYRRASEWTDQADRWMATKGIAGYTGVCQVHRAELKKLSGAWPEAVEEASNACRELEKFRMLVDAGFAYSEIGEVKRRMGDLAGAEQAFASAFEYGHPAQPGMALLLFDRGRVDEALTSIASALEMCGAPNRAGGNTSLARGALLPARVEIALAAGDVELAESAVTELEALAGVFENPAWRARAFTCRGAVDLHRGNLEAAIDGLSRAWRLWQEIGLPYEGAKARTLLGRARLAAEDRTGAELELKAARSTFARLGARRDLAVLDDLAVEAGFELAPERVREAKTLMFTDIVASTDLIALIGDEAWEDLREWHNRSLRECIRHHHGEEVNHTGDGFFEVFDESTGAIECAVEIQRKLAAHRREHGFAPWVRIGIHHAETSRRGDDFTGAGVHTAARIGALGAREEIVVSSAVLENLGDTSWPTSEPRTVELKGVPDPVDVVTLDWR